MGHFFFRTVVVIREWKTWSGREEKKRGSTGILGNVEGGQNFPGEARKIFRYTGT